MRIISLIPSATEIICSLGLEKSLVGRSHECDYPSSVSKLPICSEPKFDPARGNSRVIDQQVKKIVSESLSVYRVHIEQLQKLKPDVIVTQDQCAVCAVSLDDVKQAACQLIGSRPRIVSLRSENLQGVLTDITAVAKVLKKTAVAKKNIKNYQKRMNAMVKKIKTVKGKASLVCLEWFDPLMAAGNWVPEFIKMLKGEDVLGKAGKHSPSIAWEQLHKADPDIIVAMPCGWDIDRTRQDMKTVTRNPIWKKLQAVLKGRVFLTDGHQFFNRPGPRLVESMEILAEIIHPHIFSFGHEGKDWERY